MSAESVEFRIHGFMIAMLVLVGLLTCGTPDVVDGITHQLMTKCETPAVQAEK